MATRRLPAAAPVRRAGHGTGGRQQAGKSAKAGKARRPAAKKRTSRRSPMTMRGCTCC